jgi:hypothetical protein
LKCSSGFQWHLKFTETTRLRKEVKSQTSLI